MQVAPRIEWQRGTWLRDNGILHFGVWGNVGVGRTEEVSAGVGCEGVDRTFGDTAQVSKAASVEGLW